MSELVFATPYQSQKILSGVIEALNAGEPKRPNWLQKFYPANPSLVETTTVNFDQQYATRNVMGLFASPTADVEPVALPTFGHKELSFSYAKEGFVSDSFEELYQRQLGQQFGQVDVEANKALRFNLKAAQVEQRFENLFEKTASDILLYGAYGAVSEKHPLYVYDFGRTTATAYTDVKGTTVSLMPAANLTTSAVTAPWDASHTIMPVIPTSGGNYTAGEKVWTKALVDAGTATPYKDVLKMIQTSNEWDRASAIQMSQDAYEVFNYDIEKNYKEAASTVTLTILEIQRDILPRLDTIDSLHFQRMVNVGNGVTLPVYSYKAIYHDRTTGARTRYIGDGWVNVIPSGGFVKVHGRILHPKAMWQAMPRWMNYWRNEKTGLEEWEWHTNFIMGTTRINALCSWKVI